MIDKVFTKLREFLDKLLVYTITSILVTIIGILLCIFMVGVYIVNLPRFINNILR